MSIRKYVLSALWVLLSLHISAADYQEIEGLVVIEAENMTGETANWAKETSLTPYTGTSYIRWNGADNFSTPGNGIISATIQINTPGEYRVQLRNKVGHGTNATESNDTWLKFPGVTEFYGRVGSDKLYPKGSGMTPNPEGASKDGWLKMYCHGTTEWSWNSKTNDNNPYPVYVNFATAGEYTISLSGRSQNHCVDRIVLRNSEVAESFATDLARNETLFAAGTGSKTIKSIAFESETLLTNEGLYFEGAKDETYHFGKRITPHGDCIQVIGGYVFVTWYKGGMDKMNVMLSRKPVDGGEWVTVEFPDTHIGYRGDKTIGDSHNTIAVGICPLDSTIHLIYDMHAYWKASYPDHYFNYRVSHKGKAFVSDEEFSLGIFNDKSHYLRAGVNYEHCTYPDFQLFDDGRLMASFRFGGSGNGDSQYNIYDGNEWAAPVQFNNGNQPGGDTQLYNIYGGFKYLNGKLRTGFAIRYMAANKDDNFKYAYNNGIFYAESESPYGQQDWLNMHGDPVTIPLQDPNVIKEAEPCEIGIGNYITTGHLWTVTENEAIHFLVKVGGTPAHFYKKADDATLSYSTDCPDNNGDMFAVGKHVLLVYLENNRVVIKTTPEGENNWSSLFSYGGGASLRHCNVRYDGERIYVYAMTNGTGQAQPITLQTFKVEFEYDAQPNDLDGDGVIDDNDNCISKYNPEQEDFDNDGVGDLCDTDDDDDQIADNVDNCLWLANGDQADEDGDGIGDACDDFLNDFDNDGITDDVDNCPTVANADQKDANENQIGDACDKAFAQTYPGKSWTIPGIIQAIYYDLGGEQVAYHDAESAWIDGMKQSNPRYAVAGEEGVEVESNHITSIANDEWLLYTVDSIQSGLYLINLLGACGASNSSVEVYVNDEQVATLPIAKVGWTTFTDNMLFEVALDSYSQAQLQLLFKNDQDYVVNFRDISFARYGDNPNAISGESVRTYDCIGIKGGIVLRHLQANAFITIYAPSGRKLWEQQHNHPELTINLPQGLYLVNVSGVVTKVVVK